MQDTRTVQGIGVIRLNDKELQRAVRRYGVSYGAAVYNLTLHTLIFFEISVITFMSQE